MKRLARSLLYLLMFVVVSCSSNGDDVMVKQAIENLIAASNADEEELALSQILKQARKDPSINHGYRVFNITKNQRVDPVELQSQLGDKLEVTIFVGEEAPYQEYKWLPNDNELITRLIVP